MGHAIIRELHVYGNMIPLGQKNKSLGQHRGIGRLLLKEAENIAKDHGLSKISVISGIGVREYYYKRGYYLNTPYVSKII